MLLDLRVLGSIERIFYLIDSGCKVDVGVLELEDLLFLSGGGCFCGIQLVSHLFQSVGELFALFGQLSTIIVRKGVPII
jgi:hypothetical protein